jgi:signal transduction histidine kinase
MNRGMLFTSLVLTSVALASLFCIVVMSIWLGERAGVLQRETTDARLLRASASEMRNALQTAESSQRGYIATANQIYLAPYGVARAIVERQLSDLQNRLAASPGRALAVQRLSEVASAKLTEMDQSIALKRDRRDAEALAILRSNRGKALMDQANVFLSGIIRDMDERLDQGLIAQTENANLLRLVNVLSAIVIVAVAASIAWLARRYTGEINEARQDLVASNATLERRVAERTTELARINEEVKRFAYIVTHDLRAPLVNIIGFTGEVSKGLESIAHLTERHYDVIIRDPAAQDALLAVREDIPEAIGFIRDSARKMDGLINAILRLSREGSRTLKVERLQLGDVVEESVNTIRHRVTEAGGTVTVDIGSIRIETDRLALSQIIANLLDNAVKYHSADRPLRIAVRAAQAGQTVRIDIADNGRGIAPGDHERVFELFRRVAVDQPGEGIGLAHVRILARSLGGDVALASTPDEGSVFTVSLPVDHPGKPS